MIDDQMQEELKTLRDGFAWRGALIINLRDELAKVANMNEQLADMLEAVCEESAHLSRKLAECEEMISWLRSKMEEDGAKYRREVSKLLADKFMRDFGSRCR
ncbi:MAG: hypothetical protein WC848_02790 [Parcubacteria group bacterium]|jgi:hypothetical protein